MKTIATKDERKMIIMKTRKAVVSFVALIMVASLLGGFCIPAFAAAGDDLVAVAQNELKNYPNGRKPYKTGTWCARFVSWCGKQAGIPIPNSAGVSRFWEGYAGNNPNYKLHLKSDDDGYIPQPGDLIVWRDKAGKLKDGRKYPRSTRSNGKGRSHIGIVEKVVGDTVYAIEGNSDKKVKSKTYKLWVNTTGYVSYL